MKRSLYLFILLATILGTSLVAIPAASAIDVGSCEQLEDINSDLDGTYVLTGPIDCDGYAFTQVGVFTGTLDGAGFTISNLSMDQSEFGIFEDVTGGTVSNLTLDGFSLMGVSGGALAGNITNAIVDDVTITNLYLEGVGGCSGVGSLTDTALESELTDISFEGEINGEPCNSVGGVVGIMDNSTIVDASLEGSVLGNDYVGGFAGVASNGSSLTAVYSNADVSGGFAGDEVGGLVGQGNDFEVLDSHVQANVESGDYKTGGIAGSSNSSDDYIIRSSYQGNLTSYANVGGIVGDLAGHVVTSFAIATISGSTNDVNSAGGIAGISSYGEVENSYAHVDLNPEGDAWYYLGGLVGRNIGTITNSYSTGDPDLLDAGDDVGGLVGAQIESTVDFSFWDTETSTQTDSEGGTGKTTAEMKDIATFTTDLGGDAWDFENVWGISSGENFGYPCLLGNALSCQDTGGGGDADTDLDGISDEVENAGPNGGDANNDTILDSEQDTVASFVNPVTGQYVVVESGPQCVVAAPGVDPESTEANDPAFQYPVGLVNFTFAECSAESTVAKLFFYNLDNAGFVPRKYNPNTGAYFTIEGGTVEQSAIGGLQVTTITYTIVDGGPLDVDGVVNNTIVDPAGLGQAVVGAPRTGGGGTAS